MTNEELVAEIQAGRKECCLQLWQQVRKFISAKARGYYAGLTGCCRITIEDLEQSGFLALVDAVNLFDPERGASFLTYLNHHLHHYFNETAGFRTARTAGDPINSALSLDAPLDEDGTTLADLHADPQDVTEGPEDLLYRQQLRATLDAAIDRLPTEDADVIRKRYFRNMTQNEIASEKNVSAARIQQREQKALRTLRSEKNGLDSFVEIRTPYYRPANFRISHTSTVESLVILREQLRERMKRTEDLREQLTRHRPPPGR